MDGSNENKSMITNVGEYVEKRKAMYTAGKNVNCCSHYGKQYGHSSKNYKQNYLITQLFYLIVI